MVPRSPTTASSSWPSKRPPLWFLAALTVGVPVIKGGAAHRVVLPLDGVVNVAVHGVGSLCDHTRGYLVPRR